MTSSVHIISSDYVIQFFVDHQRFELWESDDLKTLRLFSFDDAGRRHPCPQEQARKHRALIDRHMDNPSTQPE